MLTTAESYAAIVAQRVTTERFTLAEQWLGRLRELLTVELNDVFPSDQLLDHIPLLIANIAAYLRAPADEEIAANAAVIDKARELGLLRHEQKASVHQLLREYEVLERSSRPSSARRRSGSVCNRPPRNVSRCCGA
jgi:hypothetical protein